MDEIVRTQRAVVDEHPAGNVGGRSRAPTKKYCKARDLLPDGLS